MLRFTILLVLHADFWKKFYNIWKLQLIKVSLFHFSHESSINIFVIICFIKLRGIILLIFPNFSIIKFRRILKEVSCLRFKNLQEYKNLLVYIQLRSFTTLLASLSIVFQGLPLLQLFATFLSLTSWLVTFLHLFQCHS